jgi:hypothetical protein
MKIVWFLCLLIGASQDPLNSLCYFVHGEEVSGTQSTSELSLTTIGAAVQANDLSALQQHFDELRSYWRTNEPSLSAGVYSNAFSLLQNAKARVQSPVQFSRLLNRIAKQLQDLEPEVPVMLQILLADLTETVPITQEMLVKPSETDIRKSNAALVCRAWKRLRESHRSDLGSLSDRIVNIAPPIGSNVRSGSNPEKIKDPKLRTEYEMALRRNNERNKNISNQIALKHADERFSFITKAYLIRLYRLNPSALGELQQLLHGDFVSHDEAEDILKATQHL